MPDWTQMVNEVVIAGRPADVEDAASGWEDLVRNIRDVCTNLDKDAKDLNAFWKGPAAEAFGRHLAEVSKNLRKLTDDAEPSGGTGIVQTLRSAAKELEAAQAAMPVPNSMLGELMAARDQRVFLGPAALEIELRSGFFNSAPVKFLGSVTDQFRKALFDVEEDARRAYETVNSQHEDRAQRAPGQASPQTTVTDTPDTPNLNTNKPGNGTTKMPQLDTTKPPTFKPEEVGNIPPMNQYPNDGSGLSGVDGGGLGPVGGPNITGLGPNAGGLGAGSGLSAAGAGGGLGGGMAGVGAAGARPGGAGRLGADGGGLGAAGGGLGKIPGGGSLGKPIAPGMGGGMAGLGGAGAGGGRGAGTGRAGGRTSGAGTGGVAGMGGAGAGAGGAGRGAGRGGRGAGFVGAGAPGSEAGDNDRYDTWLYEDEDVWSDGTDAPPPVLGNSD